MTTPLARDRYGDDGRDRNAAERMLRVEGQLNQVDRQTTPETRPPVFDDLRWLVNQIRECQRRSRRSDAEAAVTDWAAQLHLSHDFIKDTVDVDQAPQDAIRRERIRGGILHWREREPGNPVLQDLDWTWAMLEHLILTVEACVMSKDWDLVWDLDRCLNHRLAPNRGIVLPPS